MIIENGKARIETEGFEGKSCLDATADLEAALGTVESHEKTPEFEIKHVHNISN
jgi:hypothetical protein